MMNRLPGICIVLIMLLYSAACVSPIMPIPDRSFKIYNTFTIPLNITIYKTLEDYNNNTNIYFTGQVLAYDSLSMLTVRPDSNQTYYFDIYSNDYMATNWGDTSISFRTIGQNAHSFTIPAYSDGLYRVTFLNGGSVSTTWNAVNRYDNSSVPIWSSLSTTEQYKQLIFQKSLTGYLIQKDDSNNLVTDTITSINGFFLTSGLCGVIINVNAPLPSVYKLYNTSYPPIYNNYHATRDTILLNDLYGYWVMVRQN